MVNIWHALQKSERALVNDLSAILIFCIGGAAAYLLGGGGWDHTMLIIVLFNLLYFTGTVFFVKSVFRERTNKRWITYSKLYHVVLLLIPWLVGYPFMYVAYVLATVRAFAYAGKQMRPMKVGMIEMVGSLFFLVSTIFFFTCER
jgi:hypothetical protein